MAQPMIQQPSLGDQGFTGVWPEQAETRAAPQKTWTGFRLRHLLSRLASATSAPATAWLRRRIVKALPLPNGRILEVGVGRGGGLAQYDHRSELAGTEAHPRHIYAARRKLAARPLDHVTGLYRWTPERLGFRDAAFDAVTAFFVFDGGRRPRAILTELARVTRPGGRVFVINHLARTDAAQRGSRGARWVKRLFGLRRPLPTRVLVADSGLDYVGERRADPLGLLRIVEFAKRA
jgi:phosphatidylethanolamine/phosphatidyl-N-methylethanolamine N-methyltransferase